MLTNWLDQATSPGGILAFILGIVTAVAWHGVIKPWWFKRQGRPVPYHIAVKLTNLVMAIIALSVVWTGVRYTDLATEVAQCQAEFNEALRVRSQITTDNDHWSIVQRKALADWIHDLIFPPPNIAALPLDDPGRTDYGIARTAQADRIIRKAQKEQDENQRLRELNPYPDPTCGR